MWTTTGLIDYIWPHCLALSRPLSVCQVQSENVKASGEKFNHRFCDFTNWRLPNDADDLLALATGKEFSD